MTMYHEQN